MSKNRPLILSVIIAWFFFFHVASVFGDVLILGVDLAKAMADGGINALKVEYTTQVKVERFYPLLSAGLIFSILAGAWVMKRWATAALLLFLVYRLWGHFAAKYLEHWSILFLILSICYCARLFYFQPAKKVEVPESHLYEGPVSRSSHEPKSAVEELIY